MTEVQFPGLCEAAWTGFFGQKWEFKGPTAHHGPPPSYVTEKPPSFNSRPYYGEFLSTDNDGFHNPEKYGIKPYIPITIDFPFGLHKDGFFWFPVTSIPPKIRQRSPWRP